MQAAVSGNGAGLHETQHESRPGEQELVSRVMALREEAARAKKADAQDDKWSDWEQAYWGDQWPAVLPNYKSPIVINALKSMLLHELSDLVDQVPTVYVRNSNDRHQRDEKIEQAIQAVWYRHHVDLVILDALLDASIFPAGFVGVQVDPTAEWGQGDLDIQSWHPLGVIPDPDAEDDIALYYCFIERVMDLAEIRQRWPDKGWLVPPEDEFSTKWPDQQGRGLSGTSSSPGGTLMYSPLNGMGNTPWRGYKKARARVITLFTKDDSTEDDVQEDGEDGLTAVPVAKYPFGRMIQIANGIVLSPSEDHNPYLGAQFPLVRFLMQPTVHRFWPQTTLVSEMMEVQRAANRADSQVMENMLRMNNMETFVGSRSGLDIERYSGLPGGVHEVEDVTQIKKEAPPSYNAEQLGFGERLRAYNAKWNMGMNESRQGASGRGNVAAELTQTEVEQSMGIPRLRSKFLYRSVQRLVNMIFARMAQCYTAPRVLPFYTGGEWRTVEWTPLGLDPHQAIKQYTVHVDPNSLMLRSRLVNQKMFLALAKLNKMPTARLLKELDIPDAENVAKELQQELQMQAQAAQAQRKGRR